MREILPLAARRILITRTQAASSELADCLSAAGATVICIPTIEIVPLDSYVALDDALGHLEKFEWLVFTSVPAVEVFAARRHPMKAMPKVAVIGPATGRAVDKLGIPVSLIPPKYIAESLSEALAPLVKGASVLLIRAAEARDVLPSVLRQEGADLTIVEAYRNRVPVDSIPLLRDMFSSPENLPDVVTFTSASTARNLAELMEAAEVVLPPDILLASIGPITTRKLKELGLNTEIEAREATIPALVDAISYHFSHANTGASVKKHRI